MPAKAIQNTIIFLFFSVLIIPFLVFEGNYFPYIVGKAFIFRSIVAIMLILWGLLCFKDRQFLPSKGGLLISTKLFLIFYLISAILGPEFQTSIFSNFERMMGWSTLAVLFIFFLVISSTIKEKKIWNRFFFVQICSSILLALIGLKEIIDFGINHRIASTLGNPIYLAVILMFSIFFALYLLFENYSNKTKIFLVLSILINGVGVFLTGTRGVMVGLFIAGLFLAIYFVKKYWENKIVKISGVIFLSILILIPVLLFSFQNTDFVKNNRSLERITQINIVEGTGYARFINWGIAWEGIKERPLFGWGQENYGYVFDKYFDTRMYGQEPFFDSAHNTILDIWIHGGILSLLAYLSIFVFAIMYLFKKVKIGANQKFILLGLFIAYFIQNLFVFDNLTSFILFFVLLAFINSFDENILQSSVWQKIVLSATIIFLILIFIFLVLLPWRSNANLIKAMQIVVPNYDKEIVFRYENGVGTNQKFFEKALENSFVGSLEIKRSAVAGIDLLRKIKTNNPEIQNDIKQYIIFSVDEMIKEATKYPKNAKLKYITAIALANAGDFNLAIRFLNEAIEISPNRQLYLGLRTEIEKVIDAQTDAN